MAKTLPSKDPGEVFDYLWSVELDEGDTLASAAVSLSEGTANIDDQAQDSTGVRFWVSGGTDGETDIFLGIATTAGGRTIKETILLPIVASGDAGALVAAFPAFAAVPTASIAYWMKRAARVTDDGWPEGDRSHAQMLLTAHLLTQQGLGTGAEAEAFASGSTGFRRIRSGALEIERFLKEDSEDLQTTAYGRQFAHLLRTSRGGPRVTSSGALPCGTGYGFFGGRIPGW